MSSKPGTADSKPASTPPVSAPSSDSQASSRMPSKPSSQPSAPTSSQLPPIAPATAAEGSNQQPPQHVDAHDPMSSSAPQRATFRKPPPKPRERIYPVFPRPTNVGVLPSAMKVHPKGFKLLSARSPLDRSMLSYFRLPPQPPKRIQQEQQHLAKVIDKVLAPDRAVKGVILDGFMMLDATGVQDPEEATECVINDSNVVGAVAEDLAYFTNLTFLDVGENMLTLADLAALENLEELHLHCNAVSEVKRPVLDGMEFFPRLHTLNLSFNQVPSAQLHILGELEALQRLDLSCNNLRKLPADMSFLHSVTQLALENNKFASHETLLSLAMMPNLVEVNLNYNGFTSVPRIPDDGFPKLEVLGIAANQIVYFEDVYALTQLQSLRRVVMWGNPIEKRQKDAEILFYEFGNLQVEVVMEPPVPPKRKTGAFYAANTEHFVKVKDFRKVLTSKEKQRRGGPATTTGATQDTTQEGAPSGAGGEPSFFVTQTDAERNTAQQHQQQAPLHSSSTPAPSDGLEGGHGSMRAGATAAFSTSRAGDPGHQSWIGRWDDAQVEPTAGGILRHSFATGDDPNMSVESRSGAMRGGAASSSLHQKRMSGRAQSPAVGDVFNAGTGAANSLTQQISQYRAQMSSRASSGYGGDMGVDESEIVRPNANVRSVMAELKRMLRQPLPALHVPSFATAKSSASSNINGRR